MKFELRNIGLIKHADIELKGLTVISGHNSVGKSYIGKAIFSVIKAQNEPIKEFANIVARSIENIHEISLRNANTKINGIKPNFNNIAFNGKFFWKTTVELIFKKQFAEMLEHVDDTKLKVASSFEKKQEIELVNKEFQKIKDTFIAIGKQDSPFIKAFNNLIKNIFYNEFSNVLNPKGSITFSFEEIKQLEILCENNIISHFVNKGNFPLNEVTLIETPLLIPFNNFLTNQLAYHNNEGLTGVLKRKSLAYHIFDLTKKIAQSNAFPNEHSIFNHISKIIGGQVFYDIEREDFYYGNDQNQTFNINNVASGIKSFGLIQLLLGSEYITPDSLLIIDEPEVHLHPEWQIEYAKMLLLLAKEGYPILVTSHSPYFIEAVKIYTDKWEMNDKVRFYMGELEEDGSGSVFTDQTDDLEPVFQKLAYPMQKLIFEK